MNEDPDEGDGFSQKDVETTIFERFLGKPIRVTLEHQFGSIYGELQQITPDWLQLLSVKGEVFCKRKKVASIADWPPEEKIWKETGDGYNHVYQGSRGY